jgi:serine/threonine protein kinase
VPVSSEVEETPSKPLKLVNCMSCGANAFIPGDLRPLEITSCSKCGGELMMPMMLGHFELNSRIAAGGMGTVYRATDTVLKRDVAIKLMQPELVEDEEGLESFYAEARAVAQLNHTNIIHVYQFGQYNDQLYLVMELALAGSLDRLIDQQRTVPELQVLDVGIKIASALDTALKQKLLHRDIKPGNILFNADNEPKLVDFGLVTKAEAGVDYSQQIWGTPYYIAPEKLRREPETFLADMYSLAGTLYHAITGHTPFEAPEIDDVVLAHLNKPLTPPHKRVPSITGPTSDAIAHAMDKTPAKRYQSYDEFIMALTAARSQLLRSQLAPPSPSRPRRPKPAAPKETAPSKGWFRRGK